MSDDQRNLSALPLPSLVDDRHRVIKRALAIGQHAEYVKQPPESVWEDAFAALASFEAEGTWRAEAVATTCPKTRELGTRALAGLTIMRDADSDEDDWALPDLVTVHKAISALSALIQRAEDRERFKNALNRIAKEWTDQSPEDIREFARAVVAGGSAREPLSSAVSGV